MEDKVGIVWGKWGPYHYARCNALANLIGKQRCIGIALADKSDIYHWKAVDDDGSGAEVITLNKNSAQEKLNPLKAAYQLYRTLKKRQIKVVFLPSYWPARSLAILLASKLAGAKCIMMNESHAGTENAKGFAKWIKRQLIKLFDAALVGGSPQRDYFTSMGMSAEKIFLGYDAVDNDYFSRSSGEIKRNEEVVRQRLGLPRSYILNLGRFVAKKNLSTLINAYAAFTQGESAADTALVLVGSGEEEEMLRSLAIEKGLRVKDLVPDTIPVGARTVFFAGFRNIDENPAFFSLADLFVLPSLKEEWGLVVNEAMACGLPVIVSERVGCARDLVKEGINGSQFDPLNVKSLADTIEAIANSKAVKEAMGRKSTEIISDWGCPLFASNANAAILYVLNKK
ncbi:MAG: glycosyltransferase [Chitinophagaceae bacterium]|nr:MAG: glycosyltransferase [Chitinophagaceae bacterium]